MSRAHLNWARTWIAQDKGLYINGEWISVKGKRHFSVVNPADGEILASLGEAEAADVDQAVRAAQRVFQAKSWGERTRRERATLLRNIAQLIRQHADELATIESLTNGKTFQEARIDDLPEAADVFDYYAGWTDKLYGESSPVDPPFVNFTKREPVGVCALIVPWNFPLLLASWKLAPALAMGNTVVIKPAPYTSHSLIRLCEIIDAAKIIPPGTLNLVLGDAICGQALSVHSGVNKISFTGSTAIGRHIVRASAESNLKSVALELGGKSPNIIFADTEDIQGALQRSFTAMFSHKGEKCSEPTRLLVERPLYDQALATFKSLASAVKLGDPFDSATTQGPQCHRAHYERVLSYIQIGQEEGARLLCGGRASLPAPLDKGFFISPTIFADVTSRMRVAQEEIFGPVLAVIPFSNEEEAIAIANDTAYGLAAGVYTGSSSRAHRVAAALDAGMVFVNHYGCYDFAAPFGGFRQSGWGQEMARQGAEAFTKLKSIWIKY